MSISIERALNEMLEIIEESPLPNGTVFDYNTYANEEVGRIYNRLMEESDEVQTKGWTFNTLLDVTYTPDGNGEIVFSSSVKRIDFDSATSNGTYVKRGNKLFDRVNNTYTFSSPIVVNKVVELLDWDLLPDTAQRYILIRAGRKYAGRTLGSDAVEGFTRQEEQSAQVELEREELRALDLGFFDDLPRYGRY